MNRDIITIPLNDGENLLVATDCSGACGSLQYDIVKVSAFDLAYYTARVPFMEIMSLRAVPVAYTVSNFLNDEYDNIHNGIHKACDELGLKNLKDITSTETNFNMVQSALGITVIGKHSVNAVSYGGSLLYACIGYPLLGNEVLEKKEKILSLQMFLDLVNDTNVIDILPIGSKGIRNEMKNIFNLEVKHADVNVDKSAGPSTCVVVSFKEEYKTTLSNKYGTLFNLISVYK